MNSEIKSNIFKKLKDIEKENANKIPEKKKAEYESLGKELDRTQIEGHQLDLLQKRSNINLRKKYADRSFFFMARYSMLASLVLVAEGLGILKISTMPLTAFMGTITASMVLFGWVLKGLFDGK